VPTHEKVVLAGPSRPLGTPEIPQFHLPGGVPDGTYLPRLYGAARVHFADRRRKIDERRRVAFLLPLGHDVKAVDWDLASPTAVSPEQLKKDPPVPGKYAALPASAMELKTFTRWAKAFDRWIARTQRLDAEAKTDSADPGPLGPKRGGVAVELVAIVWELASVNQATP
jgi:hypothetical protein